MVPQQRRQNNHTDGVAFRVSGLLLFSLVWILRRREVKYYMFFNTWDSFYFLGGGMREITMLEESLPKFPKSLPLSFPYYCLSATAFLKYLIHNEMVKNFWAFDFVLYSSSVCFHLRIKKRKRETCRKEVQKNALSQVRLCLLSSYVVVGVLFSSGRTLM